MKYAHQKYLSLLVLCPLYLFLYCPIVLIMISSFNASKYSSRWAGWTWQWYASMHEDPALLTSLWHSLLLAASTTGITLLFSSLMTLALCYYRTWGSRPSVQWLLIMMIAPDLLLAIGFLVVAHWLHWPLGFSSLLIGHLSLCLPLATLLNMQQFKTIPRTLFLAAQDLGANDWHLYRDITLPLLRRSLISAGLICCVLSFDDTVLSYFLTGPDFQTLPLYLLGLIKLGITPTIHAISTIILVGTITLIVLANQRWGAERAY